MNLRDFFLYRKLSDDILIPKYIYIWYLHALNGHLGYTRDWGLKAEVL